MKRLVFFGLIVALTSSLFAQTTKDQQTVAQMCIDMDDLQMYYHENEDESRKPLIIFNDGTVPADLELKKFGVSVLFMTSAELFNDGKMAYLIFDKFEVAENQATVEFRYDVEGVSVNLGLEKIAGTWMITSSQLSEKSKHSW